MIDLNNVKSVEFVLENCEYITVPKGCFKGLELIEYENEEYELDCKIYGVDSIVYSSLSQLSSKQNPLKRLNEYNDIVRLVITYIDDSTKTFDLVWLDWHGDDNDFQTTNMISYKELDISVKVNNRNKFIKNKCDNDVMSIFNNIGHDVLDMCEEGCYNNERCYYNKICNNLRENTQNTICETLNIMLG